MPSIPDTRILSADLGQYHYVRFLLWAFSDRQSKAALLRNAIVARIDANASSIDEKLNFYSQLYAVTPNQLSERILAADREGTSIVKLHDILATESDL